MDDGLGTCEGFANTLLRLLRFGSLAFSLNSSSGACDGTGAECLTDDGSCLTGPCDGLIVALLRFAFLVVSLNSSSGAWVGVGRGPQSDTTLARAGHRDDREGAERTRRDQGCLWIGSTQNTASGCSTASISRLTTTASLSERTSTHSSVSSELALISWCGT